LCRDATCLFKDYLVKSEPTYVNLVQTCQKQIWLGSTCVMYMLAFVVEVAHSSQLGVPIPCSYYRILFGHM